MTTPVLLAASVAAIASAADCVTTAVALRRGLSEGNPVARALFGKHVVLGSAVVSAVLIGACLWGSTVSPSPYIAGVLWVFAALHLFATALNVKTLGRHE